MPEGIRLEDLDVKSLTEQALTGKRIHHLGDAGVVGESNNKLRLTPSGRRVTGFWKVYRIVFGISPSKI